MQGHNIGRHILYMDEYDELKKVRETLLSAGVDPYVFLRTVPLSHIVKDMESSTMRSEIPGIKSIFPQIKETLSITTALAQLKVADRVLEGAEQSDFWKRVWHVEPMDQPKLSLPAEDGDDLAASLEDFAGTDNANTKDIGGQMTSINFDTSDDKGYYKFKTAIKRNWIKDNNFRALEKHLQIVGSRAYHLIGKYLAAKHIAATTGTQTDTRANLDGASSTRLEALLNVLEAKLPADGYSGTRVLMHPTDMFQMKVEQWGTGGPIPLVSGAYYDANKENVREPGLQQILNVDGVFKARWMPAGTVLVWNDAKGYQVGLRQDLEFEDFGEKLLGLVGSVVSARFDSTQGHKKADWKITAFASA
jgi:hypothetical protein